MSAETSNIELAPILTGNRIAGPTHSVIFDGKVINAINAMGDLRDRQIRPDNYSLIPGVLTPGWRMVFQHENPTGQKTEQVLSTNPHAIAGTDITPITRRHCRFVLNNEHPEAFFLHEVVKAMHGKIEKLCGVKTHRFSGSAAEAESVATYIHSTPGIAQNLQTNPAFPDFSFVDSRTEIPKSFDANGRSDFSPHTSRYVLKVRGMQEFNTDLEVLRRLADLDLTMESVTCRTMESDSRNVEMVIVLGDVTARIAQVALAQATNVWGASKLHFSMCRQLCICTTDQREQSCTKVA